MKIIDAHSHLDYITHNHQPDVIGTVCCTVQENQWHELVDMIKRDNCIYGAFGIHPWFIDSVTREFDNQLEQLLNTDLSKSGAPLSGSNADLAGRKVIL